MKRRGVLQVIGAGLLCSCDRSSDWKREGRVTVAVEASETPEGGQALDGLGGDWIEPSFSRCLGLGPAAEPLVRALQARTDSRQVDLATCHAAEPRILTDWLADQSAPGDYVVVLIDPSDPRAAASRQGRWQPSRQ